MTQRLDQGFGAWIAQHHDATYDIHTRSAIYMDRMVERSEFMPFETEAGYRGDLVCTRVWPVPSFANGERPMPGWAMAWPVSVQETKKSDRTVESYSAGGRKRAGGGVAPGTRTGARTRGGDAPEHEIVGLPIRDGGYDSDTRFEPQPHPFPDWRTPFPKNFLAIGIGGVEETRQEDLLFAGTNELIAPNRNGLGIMGTLVHDLEPEGVMTREAPPGGPGAGWAARVQTMMRVVRPKAYSFLELEPGNAVAWNLGATGQDEFAGYGVVIGEASMGKRGSGTEKPESPTGSVESPRAPGGTVEAPRRGSGDGPELVVAFTAHQADGPINVGHGHKDKHQHGGTYESEAMCPAHIDTNAFFVDRIDPDRDAPLEFSRIPYEQGQPQAIVVPVTLSYDPLTFHTFGDKSLPGMWRWWTTVPYFKSGGPPGDGDTPDVPKNPPTTREPRDPGRRPPTDITPRPDEPIPGDSTTPGVPRRPLDDPPRPTPRRRGRKPAPAPAEVARQRDYTSSGIEAHIWHPLPQAFGTLLFRPQGTTGKQRDLRKEPTADEIRREDGRRPVVGRAEAFASESEGLFDYDKQPGRGRYQGGTAAGGVAYYPGELDQFDDASDPPTGSSSPTFYPMVLTPGTYLGFGREERTSEVIQECGYRVGYSASDSQIQVDGRTSGGWSRSFTIDKDFVGVPAGSSSPSGGQAGGLFFDTSATELKVHDGSSWVSLSGGGGASAWLGLSDTPSSYSGHGDKLVKVNGGETGLEFYDPSVFEVKSGKGAASGYASLDSSTVVNEAVQLLRQGLDASKPSLSEGEMYWATDTDTLYVGT